MVFSFAFAGHIVGKNAVAHNTEAADTSLVIVEEPVLVTKGSLLPDHMTFSMLDPDIVKMDLQRVEDQVIVKEGKGDGLFGLLMEDVPAPVVVAPKPQQKQVASIEHKVMVQKAALKIEPAALKIEEESTKAAVKRLSLAPKPNMIEKEFSLNKSEKQKVVAQRRVRLAEENCLARAVYFEARSESELGQMAVAKVILNRTRTEGFPKSICGVVYQGSNRRNSCQFSFACDGLPDDVRDPVSWENSRKIAKRAIAGDATMAAKMRGAVNYHADYVKPKWSRSMKRLIKIGRHIFYADG